ncbi:MAG TPA: hypothetical protein P5136_00795 [Methanofastidiosum sp.]|nr:hypothetical protein [Methanofastidiosum sp.]
MHNIFQDQSLHQKKLKNVQSIVLNYPRVALGAVIAKVASLGIDVLKEWIARIKNIVGLYVNTKKKVV